MISTDEFAFTNVEVGFIKKNFHRKYPAVMGDFIDLVRDLMKSLQTASKSKMVYNAFRYFPEGSARYHISESLSSVGDNQERVHIAINPVEPERKALFGANSKKTEKINTDIESLFNDLQDLLSSCNNLELSAATHNGLIMKFVVSEILDFLKNVKDQIVIQNKYVVIMDARFNEVIVDIDLSHKTSRSHYLKLCFDFHTQQSVGENE